jgi:hypothetical protein
MGRGRSPSIEVIAVYNPLVVWLYSCVVLAVIGLAAFVAFTGEPIGDYLVRKPNMAPFVLLVAAASAIEITRCAIMAWNMAVNGARALFVRDGRIVFISRYFASIPIAQIDSVIPGKKRAVYVRLSTGKSKTIYTIFLTPSKPGMVADKIRDIVRRTDG